jgi:hypothetical protein
MEQENMFEYNTCTKITQHVQCTCKQMGGTCLLSSVLKDCLGLGYGV